MSEESRTVVEFRSVARRRALLEAVYQTTLQQPLQMVPIHSLAERLELDPGTAERLTESLHRACMVFRVRKSPDYRDLCVIITHKGIATVAGDADPGSDPGLFV